MPILSRKVWLGDCAGEPNDPTELAFLLYVIHQEAIILREAAEEAQRRAAEREKMYPQPSYIPDAFGNLVPNPAARYRKNSP